MGLSRARRATARGPWLSTAAIGADDGKYIQAGSRNTRDCVAPRPGIAYEPVSLLGGLTAAFVLSLHEIAPAHGLPAADAGPRLLSCEWLHLTYAV